MSEKPRDDIIDLIQGLLVKTTERGCTQAEAELAAGKVQELLTKYNLSMAEITPVDANASMVGQSTTFLDKGWGKNWLKDLGVVVASAYFCRMIFTSPGWEDVTEGRCQEDAIGFIFVGRDTNVQVCGEMVRWLERQIWDIAKEDRKKLRLSGARMGSFLSGMVQTIGIRLREQRDAMEAREVKLRALVVRYSEENKEYVDENFNLMRGRGTRVRRDDAFEAGAAAGGRVSIISQGRQIEQ